MGLGGAPEKVIDELRCDLGHIRQQDHDVITFGFDRL
jgi:hypothetical protein